MQFTVTCPECGAKIPLDENAHEHLIKEVRDEQFLSEIETYKNQLIDQKEVEIRAAVSKEKEAFASKEAEYRTKLAEADSKMSSMQAENKAKLTELESKKAAEFAEKMAAKDVKITELQQQAKNMLVEKDLAVKSAVQERDTQLLQLKSKAELDKKEHEIELSNLKNGYESQLKLKDDQIEQIKDFRKKQSTKMLGENLEQHCYNSFNRISSLFPNATLIKDNDASEGSKGDFIYREVTTDGIEVLSIMFEMKNQDEDTKTKHKNEDFFKKLDSDRNKKKCEYAILVSMLEEDNELYNDGIVDISHSVPKGFVIRPQFFIPMIQILRTSALKTIDAKRELKAMQDQERDLTNFEDNLNQFKKGLGETFERARKNHQSAIDEIKKTIEKLQSIVNLLEKSDSQMNTCDNKLEDFTIKKITKNAPSVLEKLEELKSK